MKTNSSRVNKHLLRSSISVLPASPRDHSSYPQKNPKYGHEIKRIDNSRIKASDSHIPILNFNKRSRSHLVVTSRKNRKNSSFPRLDTDPSSADHQNPINYRLISQTQQMEISRLHIQIKSLYLKAKNSEKLIKKLTIENRILTDKLDLKVHQQNLSEIKPAFSSLVIPKKEKSHLKSNFQNIQKQSVINKVVNKLTTGLISPKVSNNLPKNQHTSSLKIQNKSHKNSAKKNNQRRSSINKENTLGPEVNKLKNIISQNKNRLIGLSKKRFQSVLIGNSSLLLQKLFKGRVLIPTSASFNPTGRAESYCDIPRLLNFIFDGEWTQPQTRIPESHLIDLRLTEETQSYAFLKRLVSSPSDYNSFISNLNLKRTSYLKESISSLLVS